MNKAYNFLLNSGLFKENDYVIVAVSGGPDSMCLLHILQTIRDKIKINLVCAHVNHNKRSESEFEKEFVESYCKSNNIYFEYMKIEEYNEGNFHNAAREIRYDFFKSIMNKYKSDVLLTAHHGDDLIETILMRIVRGSTLKGYAGFSSITIMDDYTIIRPLIFHTKDEIIKYNELNNLSYVTDSSNNEDDYTRNRYRHVVLPFLKSEDENVHEKFLNFSEILIDYDKHFDIDMNKYYVNNVLNIPLFLIADELSQKRIISYILKDVYNEDLSLITNIHIDLIINLINNSKPNIELNLPNNKIVVKEYDKLSFKDADIDYNYNIMLEDVTLLPNGKQLHNVLSSDDNSNNICRLSSSDIVLPLYVRNRINGDKIEVMNMDGSKKIKDIFIEKKIPMSERKLWPIVVDSNNTVLWIPGLKKSKYNKSKDENCDIIIRYC